MGWDMTILPSPGDVLAFLFLLAHLSINPNILVLGSVREWQVQSPIVPIARFPIVPPPLSVANRFGKRMQGAQHAGIVPVYHWMGCDGKSITVLVQKLLYQLTP